MTLSFGTFKRGTLLRREHVGRLVLLDIGLRLHGDVPGEHVDEAWCLAGGDTARSPGYDGRRGDAAPAPSGFLGTLG